MQLYYQTHLHFYCRRRRIKAYLPRLKTGLIVPTGSPGWKLGRTDSPTWKTEATETRKEPPTGRMPH